MNRFGSHVPILPTLVETFDQAAAVGMPSFQVFLGSPQSYSRRLVSAADIAACASKDATMFVHAPYCFSLCNPEVIEKCHRGLVTELNTAFKMGCKCGGVIVHPGSSKDLQQGLDKVAETINNLYLNTSNLGTLLLENSAGQGNTLPNDLPHLQSILNRLDPGVRPRVGVCIDTCHTFASGVTDWSDPAVFRRKVDEACGMDCVKLIHLNDSETPLRSRKDRHAVLGKGHIWSSQQKLRAFVDTFWDIPMVTETGDYLSDVSFFEAN